MRYTAEEIVEMHECDESCFEAETIEAVGADGETIVIHDNSEALAVEAEEAALLAEVRRSRSHYDKALAAYNAFLSATFE